MKIKFKFKISRNFSDEACGPYGHDIHLREICAAWKQPPVAEMTREEYESWKRVEKEVNKNLSFCNQSRLINKMSLKRSDTKK